MFACETHKSEESFQRCLLELKPPFINFSNFVFQNEGMATENQSSGLAVWLEILTLKLACLASSVEADSLRWNVKVKF